MSDVVISVENLSKRYRLGTIGGRTLREDFARWNARRRGKPDPYLRIGQTDYANQEGETVWALRDINLQVRQGEIVGIIGRNGAGKSTLLKILSRITAPTDGLVKVKGRIGSLLEVGTGFHPELTGRENIYLNGAILGMTRAEVDRKFDEIVDFSGVEQYIDTPVKRYSSGMSVRLAFAVAAHLEPEILVIDEVLAVGDIGFQQKCLGKMKDVADSGRTILFVSHSMSSIVNLCTVGYLIVNGRRANHGPVESVVSDYIDLISNTTDVRLDKRSDRKGKGDVRFESIWLEDDLGEMRSSAQSGQELVLALKYNSRLPSNSSGRVSLAIKDMLSRDMILCSSELTRSDDLHLTGEGIIRCRIPELPLSAGRYQISVFAEAGHEVQDWIETAFHLDVVDGDYFGSGCQYPAGWTGKTVLVRHEWKHDFV